MNPTADSDTKGSRNIDLLFTPPPQFMDSKYLRVQVVSYLWTASTINVFYKFEKAPLV